MKRREAVAATKAILKTLADATPSWEYKYSECLRWFEKMLEEDEQKYYAYLEKNWKPWKRTKKL